MMTTLDWWVVALYLLAMLALATWLGQRQTSRSDYYLAGRHLPSWALATSIVATQCSTNSLLGAPAFVGFAAAGGMLWLQYELAVPLAMLLLCSAFMPLRQAGVISIYAFLEQRLGLGSRLLASACFLFFRGVATGVTVYGIASVMTLLTDLSFTQAVVLLMGITIAYDLLGGMKAVVISDVVQMVLLVATVVVALYWLAPSLLDYYPTLAESGRTQALLNDWGLRSGNDYGVWPMLLGGLFLYMAYYGCDQSQAQRLLSASSPEQTQHVLTLNGLLRFPLVLSYCLLGLGLAAYAANHPGFLAGLPSTEAGEPNLNLVFPAFVAREFSPGLVGLAMVGLFAAAMSSIDSALNSLSASTVEDFIARFEHTDERHLFLWSKAATFFWGAFAVLLSFQVEHIAPTVLEAINKIGSMANGPLLALFAVATFCPSLGQRAAVVGFVVGLLSNIAVAGGLPTVSWLWWNVIGFAAACLSALLWASATRRDWRWHTAHLRVVPRYRRQLLAMTGLIAACSAALQWL